MEIMVKGDLPKTIAELRQLALEDHSAHTVSRMAPKKKNFSTKGDDYLIAYLRHNHTNYEEALKEAQWYEYPRLKDEATTKARELLAAIRKAGR